MKEIDKIIKSKTAPKSNNVLWDDGKELLINRNGKWENANTTEIKEGSIPLESLSEEIKSNLPHIMYLSEPIIIEIKKDIVEYKIADTNIYFGTYFQFNGVVHKSTDEYFITNLVGPSIKGRFAQRDKTYLILDRSPVLDETIVLYTTVNYNKIKEEFLPDSIANWNAQEGEAGYIKNRTHFFEWYAKPEDENYNDLLLGLKDKTPISVTEDGYIKTVKYLANECYPMWERNFEYFNKLWESNSYDILDGFVTVPDISAGNASLKISISNEEDDDYNELTYVTIQWNTEDTTDDVNKVIDWTCLDYYIIPYHNYEIWPLNINYIPGNIARKSDIPKDIIKTTPQTLSTADKNQALTNLGIDPVVWKYICDPLIIKSGQKVPEELIGEYNEVDDEYWLKYPHKAMYKIAIRRYIEADEYGDADILIDCNEINASSVNALSLIIDGFPYDIYMHIDKDKKWAEY